MKKRILSILLCALLLISVFPISVFGVTYYTSKDGKWEYTLSGSYATITAICSPSVINGDTVTFPGTVTSSSGTVYTVKNIEIDGDEGCYGAWNEDEDYLNVTTATFSENIVSIDNYFLRYFENITTINFPKTLTSLGLSNSVFLELNKLETITVDSKNTVFKVIDGGLVKIEDSGNTLVKFPTNNTATEYTVPKGVVRIADYAFAGNNNLQHVYLPDGITIIGKYAFESCSSLLDMPFPASLFSIGESAFRGCTSLKALALPSTLSGLGYFVLDKNAFYGCSALEHISIPDSVEYLPDGLFKDCTSLKEIVLPNSITRVDSNFTGNVTSTASAFYNVPLENVYVVSGGSFDFASYFAGSTAFAGTTVTTVDMIESAELTSDSSSYNVVRLNSTLPTVYVPATYNGKSVTGVKTGTSLFTNPTNVYAVSLGRNMTSFGNMSSSSNVSAFASCVSLEAFTCCKNLVEVPNYAFYNCRNLTGIILPTGTKSTESGTGVSAFSECKKLRYVYLPDGFVAVLKYEFQNCESLTNIVLPSDLKYIGYCAFSHAAVEKIVLPSTVTDLDTQAFMASALREITLSKNLKTFNNAFYNCESLEKITTPSDSLYFTAIDNVLYSKDETVLYCYPAERSQETSYVVNENTTSIAPYAFYGNPRLRTITFPDGLETIGASAFAHSNIAVLDCASLKAINDNAFYYCWQLTTVLLPEGLTTVGDYAFGKCQSLRTVYIPSTVTNLGRNTFTDDSNLTYVMIADGMSATLESGTFCAGYVNNIYVPDSISYANINQNAFKESATLYGHKNSGAEAYCKLYERNFVCIDDCFDCDKNGDLSLQDASMALQAFSVPQTIDGNTVTGIKSHAFENNKNIMAVALPSTIKYIGNSAFKNCTQLSNVAFADGKTDLFLYGAAFDTTNLTTVTLPSRLYVTYDNPFSNCGALSEIKVAEGCKSYSSVDGCLVQTAGTQTVLTVYPGGKGDTVLDMTSGNLSGITDFGINAFVGANKLNIVICPNTLTHVGNGAFRNCNTLTGIIFNEGLTLIGAYAFENTSLVNVTFPSTLKSISSQAFQTTSDHTPTLKTVVFNEGLESIGDNVFYNSALTDVTLPTTLKSISDHAFASCADLVHCDLGMPNSVASYIFANCPKLTSVMVRSKTENVFNDYSLYGYNNITLYGYYDAAYEHAQKIGCTFVPLDTKGDTNGDDTIDVNDYTAFVNIAVLATPSAKELYIGDLNADGVVDVLDCVVMERTVHAK